MSKLKIVGMDPSMQNWGLVLATFDTVSRRFSIERAEVCRPSLLKTPRGVRRSAEDLEKSKALRNGMLSFCRGADFAVAEIPHGSKSARAMASYGICLGVLAGCPIPLVQVDFFEVKRAATGHADATKEEMVGWAKEEHPETPWIMRRLKGQLVDHACNEHVADAVAALHAGLLTAEFAEEELRAKIARGVA